MGKRARTAARKEEPKPDSTIPNQRLLPLADILVDANLALHELVVETGLQVLEALLEQDREAICGPKHQPQADRKAYRHGKDRGQLVLGGRKISIPKPRCRSVEGEEIPLPSWQVSKDAVLWVLR